MEIESYQHIQLPELLTRLKGTQLIGHGQPLIYSSAHLSLERRVPTDKLIPAQRYVLKSDLQKLKDLRDAFMNKGIDIFSLEGGLLFKVAGMDDEFIPLTPPIIEVSYEEMFQCDIWLISDGMHRVYTARQLGMPINVILVSNVPSQYPYYAYPLYSGWYEVQELSSLSGDFKRKSYRELNYKELFRNYNGVFQGIQKQRIAS